MIHNIGDLFRHECGIDGHKDGADLGHGEDDEEELGTVGKEKSDFIALLNAKSKKGVGYAVNLALKVFISKTPIFEEEKRTFGVTFCPLL
jgi:hypothetical protein